MDHKEYKKKLAELRTKHELEINQVHIDYALSNAKFKIGDIITNGIFTISITKISASIIFGESSPVYIGPELKKDLTKKKNKSIANIYGHNNVTLLTKK